MAYSKGKGAEPWTTMDHYQAFLKLTHERIYVEQEWRTLSEFLLQSRGLHQLFYKPLKRYATSKKVVNPVAQESLYLMASGLYEMFTSPSKDWFYFEWDTPELQNDDFLGRWIQNASDVVREGLLQSNFYQEIFAYYLELGGFGTGSLYTGADSADGALYRFATQTVGEYAFTTDAKGLLESYYRTHFYTPRQMVKEFGRENCPAEILEQAGQSGHAATYYTVMQCIWKEPAIMGRPISSMTFLINQAQGNRGYSNTGATQESQLHVLRKSGFHEFPYQVGRWDLVGSELYGMGPGQHTLPNNKRLQEMEKAFLIGTHKDIDPATLAPSRLRGELTTMPGGRNWTSNPQEVVTSIQKVQLNYQGVSTAVERVEEHIRRGFFNDVFLSGSRDPNASPLRTGQVNVLEDEKLMRLGPMAGRTIHEVLNPMLQRTFAIGQRKDVFEEIPDDYKLMIQEKGKGGAYKIKYVSPLAQAQNIRDARRVEAFISFVGGVAGVAPAALDKVDIDGAVDLYAEMTNTSKKVINSDDQVNDIRERRAQAEAEEKEKQEAMLAQELQSQGQKTQSETARNFADAGVNINEVLGGQNSV